MADIHFTENDFLKQLTEVIEENLSNEQFDVSERVLILIILSKANSSSETAPIE